MWAAFEKETLANPRVVEFNVLLASCLLRVQEINKKKYKTLVYTLVVIYLHDLEVNRLTTFMASP